ncbi:MAG: ABC transporter permease [Rhizobiales bacterium]|nr:ABC transporter permease [Hyphomicrobiales bacterium]
MFEFLVDVQRSIYAVLSADIATFSDTGDWMTLLAMLPFGIVFGAAHAMTPGHSKSVLAAYVLGSGLKPARALLMSLALSVTHVSSAVVLAVIANSLVTRTLVGAGRAPVLELTSRMMLAAIGLWLIFRAIRRKPHIHGEGVAVGIMAGLIPCPLTFFVMSFALSRGVPEAGLAFSVSMLSGVAVVLGAIALVCAVARGSLVHLLDRHEAAFAQVSRVLDAVAGAALTSIALFELTR